MAFRVSYFFSRFDDNEHKEHNDVMFELDHHHLKSYYYWTGRKLYRDIRDYLESLQLGVKIFISFIDIDDLHNWEECIHALIPKTNTTLEQEILDKLNEQFPIWHQHCIPTLKLLVQKRLTSEDTFYSEALIHYTLSHQEKTLTDLPFLTQLIG